MKAILRDDTVHGESYVTLADAMEEIDRYRKDAERYRWLIKSIPAQIGDGVCGCLAVSDEYIEEAIDAAIDAARSKP